MLELVRLILSIDCSLNLMINNTNIGKLVCIIFFPLPHSTTYRSNTVVWFGYRVTGAYAAQ